MYDVTNSISDGANKAISSLNRIMRGGIGIGGIFHGAVEVYGKEWSFGYCESGSGVFPCTPMRNPMYNYRESLTLGSTDLSRLSVDTALLELSREWQGASYDLLARNCNHFCDAFCERLGVDKVPPWVNRFANAGDAAFVVAENTITRLNQAKEGVLSASRRAMQFVFGSAASSSAPPVESSATESPGNANLPSLENPSQLPRNGSSPTLSQDSLLSLEESSSDSDCDDDSKPPP